MCKLVKVIRGMLIPACVGLWPWLIYPSWGSQWGSQFIMIIMVRISLIHKFITFHNHIIYWKPEPMGLTYIYIAGINHASHLPSISQISLPQIEMSGLLPWTSYRITAPRCADPGCWWVEEWQQNFWTFQQSGGWIIGNMAGIIMLIGSDGCWWWLEPWNFMTFHSVGNVIRIS